MPAPHQQTSSSTLLSPSELAYLHSSLCATPPIRPDNRSPTTFRPLVAETSLLPNTYGSSRVCFSDGTECIVGVRGEVEKSSRGDGGQSEVGEEEDANDGVGRWVEISIDIPGTRDDDAGTAFLGNMLLEAITADGALGRRLYINRRFHWQLYIDILLLSPPTSLPLPLLSLSTHLALLDTNLPALISMGEEDPLFNDDWDAALLLYQSSFASAIDSSNPKKGKAPAAMEASSAPPTSSAPPVTLLLISVGTNIFFDPSPQELAVADGAMAISFAATPLSRDTSGGAADKSHVNIVSMRMIPPPSQLVASAPEAVGKDGEVIEEGVWRKPVGGIKRAVVKEMCRLVTEGGVGKEVLDGLQGFLDAGGS